VAFRLVVQCLNHLRYGVFKCTRGKEFSTFCTNQICLTVVTVLAIALCYCPCLQVIAQHPTAVRSILIFSSYLRIFPPSGLFASGIPTKQLCAYLLSVTRATILAHLSLDTNICVLIRSVHWLMVFGTFR
jgi:hypothetical protein